MKGKHKVVIKNNRLHYEFEIKRNGYELYTINEKIYMAIIL